MYAPRAMVRCVFGAFVLLAVQASAEPLVLEGTVPEEGDFFTLPFEVPSGTVEIEVRHDDLSSANILDFGLRDPNGFRGWGGDNPEPSIVNEKAASRSYLAGPVIPGTWSVLVGKAKIRQTPARFRVEVELRAVATLAPQSERQPYVAVAPLSTEGRWYAGDFHVHSLQSGDARPSLDEIGAFAKRRGLDFVAISDHNTTAQLDFINAAQARNPSVLFVPSVEFTTYAGHANAFGGTAYVDHTAPVEDAVGAFAAQDAVFTINHPTLDIGSSCIGCAWEHRIPRTGIGAIEVGVGGWDQTGALFDDSAIAFWDALSAQDVHVTAVGGSDDHRAGVGLNQTQSAIGEPTTYVFARELSVKGLVEGIRAGRTVVKLKGAADPFVTIDAAGTRHGDVVVIDPDSPASMRVEVTGGVGHSLRLLRNGQVERQDAIDSDPFVVELEPRVSGGGADYFRAEVLVAGRVRTLTSNVWLARSFPVEGERDQLETARNCSAAPGSLLLLLVPALYAQHRKRKRRNA